MRDALTRAATIIPNAAGYNLNGNMTYDGATTYTWDARNRLSAFGSTTFAYDSFGRRTRNAVR